MSEELRNPESTALPRAGVIKGTIVEAGSNVPLEYANIAVYSQRDSSLVTGAIAGTGGKFSIGSLPPGRYYVDAKFMGYDHTRVYNLEISRNNTTIDLGALLLKPASETISEVTVTAQTKAIAYEIDRKVIDPSQFPAAANGTAVDILANTPSVTVDIEGNVSLRGSSSFTVLIDGRPTPFTAADALQQIPASSIRNIEIITNPSAKFDPDGNAGIININTKKIRLQGVSGIVNASGDTNGSLTGDLLVNYRTGKFNFFLGANQARRRNGGTTESQTTTVDTITSTNSSSGEGNRGRDSYSYKAGFDFFINDYNTLTFNASLNGRTMLNRSDLQFEESNSLGHNLKTLMKNKSSDDGTNGSVSLDYKRTFTTKGQELTGYLYYESGNERDESLNEQFMASGSMLKGLKNWEGEENRQFRAKFDYVHPFNGKMKLETGFQSRIDRSSDWLDVYWYSTPDDYEPSPGSPYYNESAFSRDIHSLYGMLSDARTKWGYQLGLRTEYTNRVIDYSGSTDAYRVERLDWFPTLHVSYNLPGSSQIIASYTRRIDRPRGFSLTPYHVYNDAYSVSSGNPALLPEYIDSYEIGYQKQLKKGFFSTELYFRQTNNKTERVQSVYQTNVIMNTFANIGTDYSLGLELMWNFNPVKWWALNLMGNFYNYRLDGEYNSRTIETESLNWNSRVSNTFLLGKSTRLQADAMYNSPTVTAQGRREGFLFTNIAIRQDFMKNRLSATLGVRDVLNTAKFEFESEGPGFQSYRKFDMRSPVVSLTLSYRINNFRPQRQRSDNGGDGGGMMDMEGMM